MKNYLLLMRPAHWTKNTFVFVCLIFGGKLIGPADEVLLAVGRAAGGFLCFCLAASASYILNDIIDRDSDRLHPRKSLRPIASGNVTTGSAAAIAVVLAVLSLIGSFMLAHGFAVIILMYIVLMILYSLLLRRMMILDCIVISTGFCLRAIAGAVVVGVLISPWLIICTFALCLFVAFGKRRSEIAQLGENSESFRRTLAGYTPEVLAHMLDVTSCLAIACFLLYATDERTLHVFGTASLAYTTPFVLYCVFRFSVLIQKGKFPGPVELILKDVPFQIGFILWIISCIGIIYAHKLGLSLPNIGSF